MGLMAGGPFQGGERTVGHKVLMDYFAQDQGGVLSGERTVWEEILADAPFDMVPTLRNLLGAFLFSGDDINKRVGVLSGGEKNRLALARMLLRPANLLLLDEPTNHLDLFSKDILLEALQNYPGTVVFVSHDRYFVDALATRVVEVADGGLTSYPGTYEEYLSRKGMAAAGEGVIERTRQSASTAGAPVQAKEERLRQREEEKVRQRQEKNRQRRMTELEDDIQARERDLALLETEMNEPGFFDDPDRGGEAGVRHADLSAAIEALYAEWDRLETEQD
jgi:ATP-binding cassette subfamily F protein 3